MSDLTSKTVEELRLQGSRPYKTSGWDVNIEAFDELARRLEEAQQRSEARDAEVAAKTLEEVIAEIKAASEERFRLLEECRQEAEKWRAEGDGYGWNFHVGRAAGANEADLFYFRRVRKVEEMAAEYRAKAKGDKP